MSSRAGRAAGAGGVRSVPEVAAAGHDHHGARAVDGRDDLVVAHAAAGLDERADAGVEQHVDAVGEREEGVGGADGAADGR